MADLKSKLYTLTGARPPAPPPETMSHLRTQLERLSGRGVRRRGESKPVEALVPGAFEEGAEGRFFRVRNAYNAACRHGDLPLSLLGSVSASRLERLLGMKLGGEFEFSRCLFLDTETTGLAGGSGTMAFLIGVGWMGERGFQVEQYFVDSPDREAAALAALEERLNTFTHLATFNGRSYDIPLLQSRHVVNFRRDPWRAYAQRHIDLLHLSRRLWREAYGDCRLKTLEHRLLGVERHDDVEGEEIPGIYFDYLRTRDASRLARVFYHNELDILSLAGLVAYVASETERGNPLDSTADARVLANLGRTYVVKGGDAQAASERIEASLSKSADEAAVLAQWKAMKDLAESHKRSKSPEEAVRLWRRMADLRPDAAFAHVQLAKDAERRLRDFPLAITLVRKALDCVAAPRARADLQLRLRRLERRTGRAH